MKSSNLSCYNRPAFEVEGMAKLDGRSQHSRESRLGTSEINRILNRNSQNSFRYMVLDATHIRKLKDPANMQDKRLYVPEGYNTDHSIDYRRHMSNTARSERHNPLREPDPMRCSMAIRTLNQALSYKFKLRDIHKYS